MEVSPNALRKETVATLQAVDVELRRESAEDPVVKAPLLLAKAQCLNTLTLLREQGTQSKRRPLPT